MSHYIITLLQLVIIIYGLYVAMGYLFYLKQSLHERIRKRQTLETLFFFTSKEGQEEINKQLKEL